MCHLRRSSEINFLNNATCLSNVLLLPNTKSTIFFDYLHIFLFIDSIFSLLGLVVQLFMLKMNLVRFIIIFILFVSCVAYFILSGVFTTVVDDMFFIFRICSTVFIKQLFFHFLFDSLLITSLSLCIFEVIIGSLW